MSTAIANISYSKKTATLTVSFVKGGSHAYHEVEPKTVRAFRRAGSKGRYFNANIRPIDPGRG